MNLFLTVVQPQLNLFDLEEFIPLRDRHAEQWNVFNQPLYRFYCCDVVGLTLLACLFLFFDISMNFLPSLGPAPMMCRPPNVNQVFVTNSELNKLLALGGNPTLFVAYGAVTLAQFSSA